jgi:hypothetical protein
LNWSEITSMMPHSGTNDIDDPQSAPGTPAMQKHPMDQPVGSGLLLKKKQIQYCRGHSEKNPVPWTESINGEI